jgi:hypothetical protein
MVRFLFIAAALCFAGAQSTTTAQPVLTPDNTILPLVGQSYEFNEYGATSPDALASVVTTTGANMTWDISGAGYGLVLTAPAEYVESPFTDLPGSDVEYFESATHALVTVDVVSADFPDPVTVTNYLELQDSQLLNLGFAAQFDVDDDDQVDDVAVTFNPPDLDLPFPITAESEWTAETTQNYTIVGGGTFPGGTVTRTTKVVGHGTLVTPAGSTPVLQMEEETVISSFGIVTLESTTIRFMGPLQEVAGKTTLQGIYADVQLDQGGSVESVTYTVFETEGGSSTAAEDLAEVPTGLRLEPNYPNPFNPTTTIPFSVESSARAMITVHDVLGRQVAVLLDDVVPAGSQTVTWDAGTHPSGLYNVRLSVDGQVRSRSVALQK